MRSPAENINVFVDGKSLKNDIINGGVIGQDASRGNPFPRNAVQEFRIITSNFKAEYQKSSSAVITAVTKSGGNEWTGNVFGAWQNKGLVALDTFQRRDQIADPAFIEPDYSRVLGGGTIGGPVVRDKLFLFAAYEGNFQNRQGVTRFQGDPAIWPAVIQGLEGERATAPFRQHLGFAKLTLRHERAAAARGQRQPANRAGPAELRGHLRAVQPLGVGGGELPAEHRRRVGQAHVLRRQLDQRGAWPTISGSSTIPSRSIRPTSASSSSASEGSAGGTASRT